MNLDHSLDSDSLLPLPQMKVEKSERRGRGDGLGAGTNAESLALDREREEARVLKFRENKCPDFGRGLKIILDAYRVYFIISYFQ